MAEETLGTVSVTIKAKVDEYERDIKALKSKVNQDTKELSKKLSFRAKFDSSIAQLDLKKLQDLRKKLQQEFDKKVKLNVDAASLDRTRTKLDSVNSALKGVNDETSKSPPLISKTAKQFAILTAAITAGALAVKNFLSEFTASAVAGVKLNQVLKSTNQAAGFNSKEMNQFAKELEDLSGISDSAVKGGLARLLGYTGLQGEMFKKAGVAAVDMAKFLEMDLGTAAEKVGNALQYPLEAINSLTRQGFRFTEEQKRMIVEFEQTNQKAKAQQIILNELNLAYGGQAAAISEAEQFTNDFNKSIDDVSKAIGEDLVGSAEQGSGAVKDLADAFLDVNDAMKEATGGVSIFGAIMMGLSAGQMAISSAFKRAYQQAKRQYLEDVKDIKKKTEAFLTLLGTPKEPDKFTPIDFKMDTEAGDKVLDTYRQQNIEIRQIQNKLKDVNLKTEERIALEKELKDLLDKQKGKTVKTSLEIPSGYTAAQVAEFEKLKFAVAGYVEFRTAQIDLAYSQELARAQGNTDQILKAEENKKLGIARLQQEIAQIRKDGADITQKEIDKIDQGSDDYFLKQLDEESDALVDSYKKREDALANYFNSTKVKTEEYFEFKKRIIEEEYLQFLEATNNIVLAERMKNEKLKELRDEEKDYQFEQWRELNQESERFSESIAGAFTSGLFDQLKIKSDQTNNALVRGFHNMANAFIEEVERMIVKWLVLMALRAIFGGVTGGASKSVQAIPSILGGHFGGDFVGTPKGVKKLAGGGSFTVPQGYPNDSYPLLVESGERVHVTPANQFGVQSNNLERLVAQVNKSIQSMNMNLVRKDMSVNIENRSPDVEVIVKRLKKVENQLQIAGMNFNER